MSISKFQALFQPRAQLVDQNGIPTTSYGTGFINALYQRTGAGTGIVPNVSDPLVATGATLATALGLTTDWNNITGGGAGTGVAIAAALNLQPGNDIWVVNASGTNKNIFPPSAAFQIDALGAGAPFVLANGKLRCFQCWSATQFYSYGN
jgi:hypothetical protein